MRYLEDTICACATGHGGAISVIRLSGAGALDILDKVVQFKRGLASEFEGYSVHFGSIQDIDDVLVSVFRAPHSYTGEDGAEISCHASEYIVSQIMQRLIDAGARMAEPGEFTRRAFLAGKMDLSQAEAVADVIAADSEAAHRVAMNQLRGEYSGELRSLRDALLEMAALMELELDFSEEDVEFADRSKLRELLARTSAHVQSLCDSFRVGNAIRSGVPVAIVGPVNAGKSTILNALVKHDRAIVSNIPGTTRDTVEETFMVGGVKLRIIDTAGLRETGDYVEKIGIERSLQALSEAAIVIGVLDGASSEAESAAAAAEIISRVDFGTQSLILVLNKTDVCSYGVADVAAGVPSGAIKGSFDSCGTNASAGDLGFLEALLEARAQAFCGSSAAGGTTLVTNLRHYQALTRAASHLAAVGSALDSSLPTDLVAEDLRAAIAELNSIFGEISTNEVLGTIFSRFCIGK